VKLKAPAEFSCPACGEVITFIWIWQEPASSRIRIFCEECSHREEYRPLPKNERVILSYEGFQRFAARRRLAHVREKELAKAGPSTNAAESERAD
jgi:hypothetical protein